MIEVFPQSSNFTYRHKIEKLYLDVCEANSVKVASCVSSVPCMVGAKVVGQEVLITVAATHEMNLTINLLLTGIRLGFKDYRFPQFSQEEAQANLKFWESWNKRIRGQD